MGGAEPVEAGCGGEGAGVGGWERDQAGVSEDCAESLEQQSGYGEGGRTAQ